MVLAGEGTFIATAGTGGGITGLLTAAMTDPRPQDLVLIPTGGVVTGVRLSILVMKTSSNRAGGVDMVSGGGFFGVRTCYPRYYFRGGTINKIKIWS